MFRLQSIFVRVLSLAAIALAACTPQSNASHVQSATYLGTAESFTVLAGSAVTNTGATTIVGNVGVSPGTAITGFPPGIVTGGTIHSADAVALQAQNDVTTAYNTLAGLPCDHVLTDIDLGGLTLTPGVYCFASSAQLTGTLTLNAENNPEALFVFQIGSTLTTASNSSVVLINGAQPCNVYWQVGSSATLGTDTTFVGNILALTSISLNTGAQVIGRALARNGAVTLDDNHLEPGTCIQGDAGSGATDAGTTDAGTLGNDSGTVADAGASDTGPNVDGGVGMDAGGGVDSGEVADAGNNNDGGGAMDSGVGNDGGGAMDAGNNNDSGGSNDSGASNDSGSAMDSGGSTDGGVMMLCCVGVPCGATCVDLASDSNNCGACGHACAATEYCGDGMCVGCSTQCNGSCADLSSDPDNCGSCGRVCPVGQACIGGSCGVCPSANCDRSCATLATDPYNCGSCGHACSLGESCVAGVCSGVCSPP